MFIAFVYVRTAPKSTTTYDAWQVFSAKVDKRLKQLSPRDEDLLNAISTMNETFDRIKTHRELLVFLQSAANFSTPQPISATTLLSVPQTDGAITAAADLRPTANVSYQLTNPIVRDNSLVATATGASSTSVLMAPSGADALPQLTTPSTLEATRRGPSQTTKRSYRKRVSTAAVPFAVEAMRPTQGQFDESLMQVKGPCCPVQHVDNSTIALTDPISSGISLSCYSSGNSDFHPNSIGYLPSNSWDFL